MIIIDDDGGDLDLIIVFDIVRVNQSFEVVPDHVNCNGYTRGERILFFGPITHTNNIRNQNFNRIRIRIKFVFSE